jgi:hypothetical protein
MFFGVNPPPPEKPEGSAYATDAADDGIHATINAKRVNKKPAEPRNEVWESNPISFPFHLDSPLFSLFCSFSLAARSTSLTVLSPDQHR